MKMKIGNFEVSLAPSGAVMSAPAEFWANGLRLEAEGLIVVKPYGAKGDPFAGVDVFPAANDGGSA